MMAFPCMQTHLILYLISTYRSLIVSELLDVLCMHVSNNLHPYVYIYGHTFLRKMRHGEDPYVFNLLYIYSDQGH